MIVWFLDPWDALPGEIGFERGQQIVRALAAAGHEVVWWQSGFAHAEKKTRAAQRQESWLGSRQLVVLLPARPYASNVSPRRLLSIGDYVWGFMRASRGRPRPDAILVSGPIFFSEPALLYFRWIRRIPLIFEFRDLWPETIIYSVTGPRRWLRWAIFGGSLVTRRVLFRACDGLVGLNRTYLEIARREAGMPAGQLAGVAYPSPAADPVAGPPPQVKPPGQTWVISAGTLGASHDHQTLLSAAELLKGWPELRFLITGTGAYADEIRATIAARRLNNVDFLGPLPKREFRALLAECDLGLALYRRFSPVVFPTKIVDYMLAGLGVVTSAQGEGAAIITSADAGQAIPAEDTGALVTALETWLQAPGRIAALKENSARLALDFAQDRQIQVIVNMVETAANRQQARAHDPAV